MKDVQFYTGLPGEIVTVEPANPAAGANLSFTVPAGFVYSFIGGRFQFVASAAVANRLVTLAYRSNTPATISAWRRVGNHVAAETKIYYFAPDSPDWERSISNDIYTRSFPKIMLLPDYFLETIITNIQAADQISNVVLNFERWRI